MNQIDTLFNQLSKSQQLRKRSSVKTNKKAVKKSDIVINDELMKSLRDFSEPIVTASNIYEWTDLDNNSGKQKQMNAPKFKSIH